MAYQLVSKGKTKCLFPLLLCSKYTADLSSTSLCEDGRSIRARKRGYLRSHEPHSTSVGPFSFIHSKLLLDHLLCAWHSSTRGIQVGEPHRNSRCPEDLVIIPGVISLLKLRRGGMKLCFFIIQFNVVLKGSRPFDSRKQSCNSRCN